MSIIPESAPMHPDSSKAFHSLRAVDVQDYYKSCINQFYQCIYDLLNLNDTSDLEDESESNIPTYLHYEVLDPIVRSTCESYLKLLTQMKQSKQLTDDTARVKKEYKLLSDQCETFTLDTWDKYVSKELTAPKLSELFNDRSQLNNPNTQTANALPTIELEKDKLLRVLPYLWQNPANVIPDEVIRGAPINQSNTDDDLKIEGGVIELTCPITCKTYRRPMISKKCGHVFDEQGIKSYLETQGERDCPQAACSQKVKLSDFSLDKIMILRCKINKIKQLRVKEDNDKLNQELDIL
ncbi:hypothetical protein TPHA_0O00820 [Tetrapisispora phaffii CBS 4417]|uniref:SP-RING-type domain-containing protein n=1 Tax=Tetrapisispora phaffii (strain ATCC 24235 / CBS 4417 / NBRC 1672 / NRRL Y-8282 / UCD 70-5) TaxID=1071381 RepID=G8C1M3_TETPH|nr:hypothetical protein TPHA_0O00820 [Tetrapisispora phaffii CBS 4417]CCE66051.1 hypothetical protein TPHA_0O00820 [Tetrapisispora phaffii CBS 4417]